ncbi:MAG: 23S rRNA (guanosine(2251)-2'-O)-methyltransferase RlmB [Candidatus Paracaedibacteraceae bacterium]|nr:23S rRNA (guanosine(2251)-2'-O)-methyltransferase RlmB [Candidatus Paracaedibacteraceae bacterium]
MLLYGLHPCISALNNPDRVIEKIYLTDKKLIDRLPPTLSATMRKNIEIVPKEKLIAILPREAVHQGIALKVQPLEPLDISDVIHNDEPNQIIVILDQVSDPHNIGAILRSAAVFGANALILTDRHAPKETPTLAKSASGALEHVPLCFVKNLAQTLKAIKEAGFWCVAFAEEATQTLSQIDLKGKIALVLGAEGDGLRRLTSENCDFYVKLQSTSEFSTLNVSNAAAIALYETFQQQNK